MLLEPRSDRRRIPPARGGVLSYWRVSNAFPRMKDDDAHEVPDLEAQERQRRRDMRRAFTFGIVMATIQMGILIYFMYC